MRAIALALTFILPVFAYINLKAKNFEENQPKLQKYGAPITFIILAIIASTFIIMANTPPKTIWWIAFANGIGLSGINCAIMFGRSSTTIGSIIVMVSVSFTMLIMPVLKLTDDNPYQVNHGQVINHAFKAEHYSPVCSKTGCIMVYIGNDWAIQIQECDRHNDCRTGWIHFNSNIFNRYPIGSRYP